MLDFNPRPQHDYSVSAKKALIRVESLKQNEKRHAAFVAVFSCLVFLIRSLWAVMIGGFARWALLFVQPVFQPVVTARPVIESTDGITYLNGITL